MTATWAFKQAKSAGGGTLTYRHLNLLYTIASPPSTQFSPAPLSGERYNSHDSSQPASRQAEPTPLVDLRLYGGISLR